MNLRVHLIRLVDGDRTASGLGGRPPGDRTRPGPRTRLLPRMRRGTPCPVDSPWPASALILATGTAQAQVPYGNQAIPAPSGPGPRQPRPAVLQRRPAGRGREADRAEHRRRDAVRPDQPRQLLRLRRRDRPLPLGGPPRHRDDHAEPASVNSTAVFVTNSNQLFGLDRKTGRLIWKQGAAGIPSSSTAADDERVMVGLESGKLVCLRRQDRRSRSGTSRPTRRSPRSPVIAGKVVAFGSEDSKLYLCQGREAPSSSGGSRPAARSSPRWARTASGPCSSPRATSPSTRSTSSPATTNWILATGAPVEQEPLSPTTTSTSSTPKACLTAIDIPTGTVEVDDLHPRRPPDLRQPDQGLPRVARRRPLRRRSGDRQDRLRPGHDLPARRDQPPGLRARADEPVRRPPLLRHQPRPGRLPPRDRPDQAPTRSATPTRSPSATSRPKATPTPPSPPSRSRPRPPKPEPPPTRSDTGRD